MKSNEILQTDKRDGVQVNGGGKVFATDGQLFKILCQANVKLLTM